MTKLVSGLDLLSTPAAANDEFARASEIEDRLSQELVIALIGPISSGVSTAAALIQERLETNFSYKVFYVKASKIIADEMSRVGMKPPIKVPLANYITVMQTAGNALREKFGSDYLAKKAIEQVYLYRKQSGGINHDGVHLPGRRAYVIDSIKNPEELHILRKLYGDTLCVFGIFAPDHVRKERLRDQAVSEADINKVMDRDQSELETFGQKTRKIFVESDMFICNDSKKESLQHNINRFLDLLFDSYVHTPTRDEFAMYEAAATAANSACMSRQVGAAILSSNGEIISVGWNDVPKFGGGLYCENDQMTVDGEKVVDRDYRCFKWRGCVCHNEQNRNLITTSISEVIVASKHVKRGVASSDIKSILDGKTQVDSLIEFSRSIHAEMEAILAVAREGRHSLVGATLYTTTYPCHNCARHIVAAGISRVIYVEPYQKSMAISLHNDAISEDPREPRKVIFRQYEGVAPRNYLRLFRPKGDRKTLGKLTPKDPKEMLPVFRKLLDAQKDYEAFIIAGLTAAENDGGANAAGGGER